MNTKTVKILCKVNNDFYRNHYASFSETRTAPWPGWRTCLAVLRDACLDARRNPSSSQNPDTSRGFSVFDLACGNLRFEAFLTAELPETPLTFYAVDNCDSIVPHRPSVNYQSLDILGLLQEGRRLSEHLTAPLCDLSVSFGFMHHVPLQEYRKELLSNLIRQTCPGGYVVVSFWQFLRSEAMREKAQASHNRALVELGLEDLDDNDYLLGWKNIPGAYRYCHSFSDAEIDQLVEAVTEDATLVARFASDGRTDDLNTYVILRVN